MPKLPAYVFRRQNGSYRYKRNVPKKLRPLIGKDTLYRQLGESYSEAMKVLPKVHLEIEQLFAAEEMMPANERALVNAGLKLHQSPEQQCTIWQILVGVKVRHFSGCRFVHRPARRSAPTEQRSCAGLWSNRGSVFAL